MEEKYLKAITTENNIYRELQQEIQVPATTNTGWKELDEALDWLCMGAEKILDFGCGNGSMLFHCALRGTKEHLGIDLAEEGIRLARLRAEKMPAGNYRFLEGSSEALSGEPDSSVDSVILSNILDNLYPEDAETVLNEANRLLRPGGKLMVKLNPFLAEEQITEWGIRKIREDLLDDGLILWNRSTEAWQEYLKHWFSAESYAEMRIPEAEQVNRIFCLRKK